MFFGEARKALLEFLRNLTPQILFMTLAIILGAKLDLSHFDLSLNGIKNAGPFVMCIIVFMGAAMANTTLFIDSAITSNESLDKAANEIKEMRLKALPRTWHLACAAWKLCGLPKSALSVAPKTNTAVGRIWHLDAWRSQFLGRKNTLNFRKPSFGAGLRAFRVQN